MKPYYQADNITLYCGDLFDVLPFIKADVTITDPPYNAGKNYGPTTNDKMEWTDWCAWWDSCLDLMLASTPDVFSFLSQTAYKKYMRLGQHEIDWALAWVKPLSLAVCAMPFMPHWEPIAYWGKTRKKDGAFWGGDVITCNVGKEVDWHPTPKPLALMRQNVSRFEGVILDPFCGSGTTLVAAKELGKAAIGVEISEAYCQKTAERLMAQPVLSGFHEAYQQGDLAV